MIFLPPQRHLAAWAIASILFWTGPAAAASSDQIKAVARDLVCLCGDCNRESLATCLCGFAASDRERIGTDLDAGLPQQQIIQQFVDDYGPVVLATPAAEGLNLLAWIAPITLLCLGIVLVRSVLLNWRRAHTDDPKAEGEPEPMSGKQGTGYDEKLRRELDQYDES